MKVWVKKLDPNPFRRMGEYPIDREKVESLKASIADTSFWDNILARKAEDRYQIAYGHHRLVALQELEIEEVDIPVKDINDGMMIKIMANENRDTYRANRAVIVETVRVARDWLREQMEGGWGTSDKSIKGLFVNEHAFDTAKGMGVGRDTIRGFLGPDWKEWEIQEALSQLVETDKFDPKAMEPFEKIATAASAKQAMIRYKVPKTRQRGLAKKLAADGVAQHKITQAVADVAKKEGWTAPPKTALPKMPPDLDVRIDEIIGDIGSLAGKLSKVRGYLSYIKNQRLSFTLQTQAKILQSAIGETLQELGG